MRRRTSNILRTVTAAALCLTLAVSGKLLDGGDWILHPVKSYADTQSDLQKKIAEADAKIKEIEAKIAAAGSDIESNKELQDDYWNKLVATQNKIDLVNLSVANKEDEIEAKEAEIANVELRIQDTEFRIKDKEAEIDMLDRKNKDNIYRFGQIIHAMYITDSDDYLSIIAGSADFYDIFVRSEIMKSVKEQNLNFMNMLLSDIEKLKDDEVQLEKDKKQLQSDKITLEEEKDELLGQKQKLDEEKKYYNDLNSGYWDEYNTYAVKIQDLETRQANLQYQKKVTQADREKAEKELEEEIRRAQERAKHNTVYDTGEWAWPVSPNFTLITTTFGYDAWRNGNHGGIDIGNGGMMGANIYASKGGEVIVAKTTYVPGYDYGMYVVIDHGNGYQTLYAHCSAIYVSVGQVVNKGDCIAAVGATGWATGPHLHFEVRKDGVRIDPLGVVAKP
ncbi:MAG: peptidoglycan DD-metalloendopeptidase family protein [Ruminiclostridium sp.]|nr:peptidoglycan DD-metalloendopeptidase family protein [Ruminiclostridium sp.]